MAVRNILGTDVGVSDLGFGLLSLGSVACTLISQFVWIAFFDSTGLDTYAPDVFFLHVLPAITLALVPTAVARYLYTRTTVLVAGGTVFTASAVVSTVTVRFFRLCGGPGC